MTLFVKRQMRWQTMDIWHRSEWTSDSAFCVPTLVAFRLFSRQNSSQNQAPNKNGQVLRQRNGQRPDTLVSEGVCVHGGVACLSQDLSSQIPTLHTNVQKTSSILFAGLLERAILPARSYTGRCKRLD